MCEQKDVLVIIPAYNEEKNISRVVDDLIQNYPQYDYVIVNDGSRDKTAEVCRKRGYHLIDLSLNLGLAGAFQTGMKYAYRKNYNYAIQFDADGQHLPQYIENMYKEAEKGADIVIGSRFVDKKKGKSFRMFGSNMISLAIRVMSRRKVQDPTSGMRMFNREMIKEFAKNLNYGPEPDTISYLLKKGAIIKEIQVEMQERIEGESYLSFAKSILYMLRMMISILIIQNFRK